MYARPLVALLAVAIGTTTVGLASAQPRPDARLSAVAHRQGQMKRMREATKAISGFIQGAHNDPGQVRAAAAALQDVGARMPRLWARGTAVGVGKSRAKPQIWTEQAAFLRRIAGFRAASAAFARAAATGDKAQIGPAFRNVGASCKACHDFYQAPPL